MRDKGLDRVGSVAVGTQECTSTTRVVFRLTINNYCFPWNNINQTLIIASNRSKISPTEDIGELAGRIPMFLRHRLLELAAGRARATMSYFRATLMLMLEADKNE